MTISLIPSISRNNVQFGEAKKASEFSTEENKTKLKKLIKIEEYSKGALGGLIQGGILGGIVLIGAKIRRILKRVPKEVSQKGKDAIKKFKRLQPKNFIASAVILASSLAIKLYKSHLKASLQINKVEKKYSIKEEENKQVK